MKLTFAAKKVGDTIFIEGVKRDEDPVFFIFSKMSSKIIELHPKRVQDEISKKFKEKTKNVRTKINLDDKDASLYLKGDKFIFNNQVLECHSYALTAQQILAADKDLLQDQQLEKQKELIEDLQKREAPKIQINNSKLNKLAFLENMDPVHFLNEFHSCFTGSEQSLVVSKCLRLQKYIHPSENDLLKLLLNNQIDEFVLAFVNKFKPIYEQKKKEDLNIKYQSFARIEDFIKKKVEMEKEYGKSEKNALLNAIEMLPDDVVSFFTDNNINNLKDAIMQASLLYKMVVNEYVERKRSSMGRSIREDGINNREANERYSLFLQLPDPQSSQMEQDEEEQPSKKRKRN